MRNPETVYLLVKLFGVIVGVFWFLCFCNGLMNNNVKPLKIPERFDIGYIDAPKQNVTIIKNKPRTKQKTVKKKQKQKKKKEEIITKQVDTNLLNDCVGALISLGTRRSEAQRATIDFLSKNPNVTNVEQFLRDIFKRNV